MVFTENVLEWMKWTMVHTFNAKWTDWGEEISKCLNKICASEGFC